MRYPASGTIYFGLALYLRAGEEQVGTFLAEYVLKPSLAGIGFTFLRRESGTGRNLTRRLDATAIKEVLAEPGDLPWISLYDRQPPREENEDDYPFFEFRSLSPKDETYLAYLVVPAIRANAHSLMQQLRQFSAAKGVFYGFLLAAPLSPLLSLITGTFVAAEVWAPGVIRSAAEMRRQNEVFSYNRSQNHYSRCIPRAFWGNLLSREHAAKMGGVDKLSSLCGSDYNVEDWGTHIFISLRSDPLNTPAAELLALTELLSPLRCPDLPEPSFPDATSEFAANA